MNYLIILGGGVGSRVGKNINKVFINIKSKPIIYHTIKTAQDSKTIDKIIISVQKKHIQTIKNFGFSKVFLYITPSTTRQDTTHKILKTIKDRIKPSDLVGIHNAANPLVTKNELKQVYQQAQKHGSALLATPAIDTIKITDNNNFCIQSPPKPNCWQAQTPQVARFDLLKKAFDKAQKDNYIGTDDTQLLLRINHRSKIVICSRNNFKITFPEDICKAKKLIS